MDTEREQEPGTGQEPEKGPETETEPEQGPGTGQEPEKGPETETEPEPEEGTGVEDERGEGAPVDLQGQEVLSPEQLDLGPYLPVTEMRVLVATNDAKALKEFPGVPITGVRFDDGRYLIDRFESNHPLKVLEERPEELVETLASGQVAMAQASFPQPVYVQLSDLRSDVYGPLEGGEELEEEGCLPSMGFRGVARLISTQGEQLLRAEARAIRKARRDMSMTNLHVVIPFPRTVDEVETLYNILFEEGVRRAGNLRVYIDISVPSTLLFLHLYSQVSDGFFLHLDELLPALLSIDPTSEGMRGTGYLTSHEKAVRQAILLVTEAAHQAKKEVIIETRAHLDAELVEFLLRIGIGGICLGIEGLRENVALISQVEHDLQEQGKG
jgi:pyruvate,water dikinase